MYEENKSWTKIYNGFWCVANGRRRTTRVEYVMKNKQIDHVSNIISTHHGIFTKIFTIFFSNARKPGNVSEFKFDKHFWR